VQVKQLKFTAKTQTQKTAEVTYSSDTLEYYGTAISVMNEWAS